MKISQLAPWIVLIASARAFAQANPPTSPPAGGPPAPARQEFDPDQIRKHWDEMPREERRRIQESFEKWQRLSSGERELMHQRHERLEAERRRADQSLPDDDRKDLEQLHPDDRRDELTRRAKEVLRERFDRLPPELRDRVRHELEQAPPAERQHRAKAFLKNEIERAVRSHLKRKVESGELAAADVEALMQRAKDAPGLERLELLRNFIVEHAQAFHLTPEQQEHIRSESDPAFALHLLDRLRHTPPPGPRLPLLQRLRESGRLRHGVRPPFFPRPRPPHDAPNDNPPPPGPPPHSEKPHGNDGAAPQHGEGVKV